MKAINYYKLINFIRGGNPLYEIRESGDSVELLFHAPSEEEASGTEAEISDEPRPIVRIVFARVGDELIPREAWLKEVMQCVG
ncbi:hypothetical protein [Vulcanisaeta distributa]|uniref:hypothetical protein n=1 Tax=Vulcanisaeta distributa TaxID=164451 RepID=UPI000AB801F9|nr:hypothetical protein [Vulcanisaeta distributa]